ncbi:PAS domain S-box protein [Deinococcus hopiensis]|uniref:histidine kinase n=1 Tax=Deinococcus hopiensis KR-140 TaxID=695939 RepID=A0A1W1UF42_9DEIO|nr:PAS domain S-box protein [Deinococcus hopiensis]SMB79659.1 PAS domain S-box-containing protein [Deinococcus hopiensis KR-140]
MTVEPRLQTLLQLVDGIVWEGDPASLVHSFVSDKVEALLGYTAGEWLAAPDFWMAHIHPEDRERVLEEVRAQSAACAPFELEYRMLARDGRAVWFRDRVTPLVTGGQPVRLGGVMTDITRLREDEARMQGLHRRFEQVFAAMPIACGVVRARDGQMMAVNSAWLSLLGFAREDVLGQPARNLNLWADPADRERVGEALGTHGRIHETEFRIRARGGQVLDVLSSLEPVEFGGEDCLLYMMVDITGRKRAEAELQGSREVFHALFEHSPEAIVLLDPHAPDVNWKIVDCNGAACAMNGYTREELLGQSVHLLRPEPVALDGRELQEQRRYLEQLRNRGKTRFESLHRRKDGSLYPVEISTTTVHIGDRELVLGIDRDVTERHEAEAALEKSRAQLRQQQEMLEMVFTSVPDAIFLVDPHSSDVDWKIVACNGAACTMNGYTREELIGQPVGLLDVEPIPLEQKRAFLEELRKQGLFRFPALHRRKGGEVYPVEIVLSVVQHGGQELVLGIDRDITEQRRASEALERSHTRFRSLVQNSSDIITVLNRGGYVTYATSSLTALLGYEVDEVLGQPSLAYMHPDEYPAIRDTFAEVVCGGPGAVGRLTSRYLHKDGSWRWMEWVATNRLNDPSVCGLVLNTRDVTERRLADEALKASRERLLVSEKLAGLGRLTAGLAHEINTPLAATMNYLHEAERLAEEYRASVGHPDVTDADHSEIAAELKSTLEEAGKTTARIGEFIRTMRGHTRDTASGVQEFDAVRLASETLLMLAHQARGAQTDLLLEQSKDPVRLRGEPGRFTQVLTNLVVNAIHACEAAEQARRVTVAFEVQSGQTVMRVEDTGTGIGADVLPRIFDPLFTTKDVGKGTGLGLAIIHDIVTGHFGGTIEVRTEPGQGTTFGVTFPG